jgi:hypothetical protein
MVQYIDMLLGKYRKLYNDFLVSNFYDANMACFRVQSNKVFLFGGILKICIIAEILKNMRLLKVIYVQMRIYNR